MCYNQTMVLGLLKILVPTMSAFFIGIFITPIATHFFYKYKMWKKRTRSADVKDERFGAIHAEKEKREVSVPCVGGIIIWVSILITTFIFYVISLYSDDYFIAELNFYSRAQTLLPLGLLMLGALAGLSDDILEIVGLSKITRQSKLYTYTKITLVAFCGVIAGFWFYQKLGITTISIPFHGFLYLGALLVPFVVLVMLATFSGGVIDGLDGLSGGVLSAIFSAYTGIALVNGQYDLAAFSGVITGSIAAFLWFNIPPARFYMGETGMMALTIILTTLAFLTDTVLLLPIIAFPLVATSLSVIIQKLSKRFRNGKKVFRVAPLHHHFESIGWSASKVVMRYWIISFVFAILGVIIHVINQ